MLNRSISVAVLIGLFAGCQAGDDEGQEPLDEAPPDESVTLLEGETAFTTQVWVGDDGSRHYRTTGIESGRVVATMEALRAPGSSVLPYQAQLVLGDDTAPVDKTFELDVPLADEKLDGLNWSMSYMHRMTVKAARAAETGLVEQDMPGCDQPWVGGLSSCGSSGHCCDRHDKCYADNGCTSASWGGDEGEACSNCNTNAMACTAGSIGIGFGIGFLFSSFMWQAGVVGLLVAWLFPVVGEESDCCREDGMCLNSACTVSWYEWGNHACEMSLINIYCSSQEYWLPNGAGPYYYWQGCYKFDQAHQVTYRLPSSQVWCDSQNENGFCSDSFDCPDCPAGLNETCNPPFFTAGSYMDQICTQGVPAGTPIPSGQPLPSVPTCADAGGNTCDNDMSNGSACGPNYDLRQAYDCVHCCCVEGNGDCAPACGDNQCNGDEDCLSCPGDCGDCETCDDTCYGCDMTSACGTYCGDCPEDVGFTAWISPGGSPLTVSLTTEGANALVYFNGEAGQRVSLRTTNQNIYAAYISILTPSGVTVAGPKLSTSSGGTFMDVVTLPDSGQYRIVFDPYGTSTGSLTATLYDVPEDPVASISPDGAAVMVSIGTAGQNAHLTFAGSAGQRVSLRTTPVTIYAAYLSIRKPDGSVLAGPSMTSASGGSFMDVVTLPVNGTYTILVDGYQHHLGNVTVTLYDVPPDPTASITPDGAAVTVSITDPGQNPTLTFAGSAGQRVSLRTTPVTIYAAYLSIRKPDGSVLAGPSMTSASGGSFMDVVTLPVAGTYTILVDGYLYHLGDVTVTVYDVPPDPTASITPGGSAVAVSITDPGQNAILSFSGSAGQRVSVRTTPVTIYAAYLSIRKPDGSTLAGPSMTSASGGSFMDVVTLPVSGTYTILVDGYQYHLGNVTTTLYNVPPNPTGTINTGFGSPSVTVSLTTPGQNGTLTFSGTTGQAITLLINNVSISSAYVSILRPNGTTQVSPTLVTSSGKTINSTLTTTGTHTIVIDGYSYYTGNLTLDM